MDTLDNLYFDLFGDSSAMMLTLLIFVATAVVAFVVMAAMHSRGAVKRRAAGINAYSGASQDGSQSPLRQSSLKAVQRVIDYTNKHYSADDKGVTKILRRRLIHAGIFDSRAVAFFFIARTVLAIGLGLLAFFVMPMLFQQTQTSFNLCVMLAGIVGYLAPGFYISRRIASRRNEHRLGFPDFMDLLVVCADSGLSMEASLERVGRELGEAYPSLCTNIHMTNLEIRAGSTMTTALENFGDRIGLEEGRSFATLVQQSAELGSSITDALRVYSEDMRHKRLSRAEEKAYSLPAKLAVPMMVCIFPVLFVVILLPVVVRLVTGHY
jgi:tight adherence protein C